MVEFVAELRKHVLLGCVDCDSFTKSGKKIGGIAMAKPQTVFSEMASTISDTSVWEIWE